MNLQFYEYKFVFISGASVASASSTGTVGGGTQVDTRHPADVLDMPVDPNEPTYCLCHQVSYGEMIGCDNPDVSFMISTLNALYIILNLLFYIENLIYTLFFHYY